MYMWLRFYLESERLGAEEKANAQEIKGVWS